MEAKDKTSDKKQDAPLEFDLSKIQPTQHEFIQRGSMLVCQTTGHSHAYPVRPNKLLDKTPEGRYVLRDI